MESWTARCDGGFGLLVNREEVLEKRGWGKRGGEWVVLFMLGGGRVLCGCSWLYST